MYKLCIGLLTHCNDEKIPKRFEIMKKSIDSLSRIKRDDIYIYVWDNNSSENVRDYLKSKKFFNGRFFSKNNLYDYVGVLKLAQKAKDINADYVCFLEDDFLFYRDANDYIDDCFEFMENNLDCGYLRFVKYDFDNKDVYDKFKNHPNKDVGNCQRHFNNITKEPLLWTGPSIIGENTFYKNNWHWYNYPSIARLSVFDSIIPKEDCHPMHGVEGYMMKKYNDLNLKVGVMNMGVVTHLDQELTKETSTRINIGGNIKKLKKLSYKEAIDEIAKVENDII